GAVFLFVEMIAVTLDMPLGMRAGVCAASLVTAVACLVIYARGPWMALDVVTVREREDPS
ncbi:MAG: hypothetical protein LC793_04065, partial [Thermomicrobia bacterium]|nr:hypothetical protein [Thermomicrobia bacterium]MCA1725122.1 hypothetical protein [Thermomicrobia bacterium]